MRRAIRHVAAIHGTPDRCHETLTIFWTRLVALHGSAETSDFDTFAGVHPQLLDKELAARHYAPATLWSEQARLAWVEPDRVALPSPR